LKEADSQSTTLAARAPESQPSAGAEIEEVRVLARGLTILRVFTPKNEWLSNHEIAAAADLPRPTVSRLAANLAEMGYLETSGNRGQYRLGTSVLALGYAALNHLDIFEVARAHLARFAEAEDALVVLATRDGLWMVCNQVHYSRAMLTLRVNVGSRLALARSAVGGALIGALPEAERADLLEQIRAAYPKEWPELAKSLASAVVQMREEQFCTRLGTLENGVNGMGAMIELASAPHKYVIGIAAPAFRFTPKLLKGLGPRLLEVKCRIEAQMATSKRQD
jgi:DNA-binding IclR family transcriptional regulator